MKVTQVILADTRPGWLSDSCFIGEYGKQNLEGCRSIDFMTDAVIAKKWFIESELVDDSRVSLLVDEHEPITPALDELAAKVGDFVSVSNWNRSDHRWYDKIQIRALRMGIETGADVIVKWDGDCIGYRREGFDFFAHALELMDKTGAAYICQSTPLNPDEHGMKHASTRFFLCRAETLDLDKAEWLLDDFQRAKTFPCRHLPCLEHILGAMAGDRVCYPKSDYDNWVVWSWVKYFKGTIAKLNAATYGQVLGYIEDCGGVHGASDLVGQPL